MNVNPVFLVLTTRLKSNEAKESLVFFEVVQNALARYAERNIGSNGVKAITELMPKH